MAISLFGLEADVPVEVPARLPVALRVKRRKGRCEAGETGWAFLRNRSHVLRVELPSL